MLYDTIRYDTVD